MDWSWDSLVNGLRARMPQGTYPPSAFGRKLHEGRQFATEADAQAIEADPMSWDILTSGLGAVSYPFPLKAFRGVWYPTTPAPVFRPSGPTFFSLNKGYSSQYGQGAGQHIIEAEILPKKIFDYENVDHIKDIVAKAPSPFAKEEIEKRLKRIKSGEWAAIENPFVQDALKASGYDSFYTFEGGVHNVGVLNPEIVKVLENKKRF